MLNKQMGLGNKADNAGNVILQAKKQVSIID